MLDDLVWSISTHPNSARGRYFVGNNYAAVWTVCTSLHLSGSLFVDDSKGMCSLQGFLFAHTVLAEPLAYFPAFPQVVGALIRIHSSSLVLQTWEPNKYKPEPGIAMSYKLSCLPVKRSQ